MRGLAAGVAGVADGGLGMPAMGDLGASVGIGFGPEPPAGLIDGVGIDGELFTVAVRSSSSAVSLAKSSSENSNEAASNPDRSASR